MRLEVVGWIDTSQATFPLPTVHMLTGPPVDDEDEALLLALELDEDAALLLELDEDDEAPLLDDDAAVELELDAVVLLDAPPPLEPVLDAAALLDEAPPPPPLPDSLSCVPQLAATSAESAVKKASLTKPRE